MDLDVRRGIRHRHRIHAVLFGRLLLELHEDFAMDERRRPCRAALSSEDSIGVSIAVGVATKVGVDRRRTSAQD